MLKYPHSCENSSNLQYLDLSFNEDLHIDNLHWLSRVPCLEYLSFSGINLHGKVDWVQLATLLPSLKELHMSDCLLVDIDPSLQYVNFTSLEVITLRINFVSSRFLPHWLLNLSDVKVVELSYNNFHGQLPERLLNLQKIEQLYLRGNMFNGPIPDWLDQLKNLKVLLINENLFSDPIPSTLGNLSSLIFLDVSSNHLNDSFPESLGQLLNLEELGFGDNHLTGHLSEKNFVKLSNLKYLSMGSPGLIYDFHSLWVPPFQLEELILTHLVGPKLPAWLYTQTSLARLEFTHSRISFESRDHFWDFATRVTYLDLHDNMIDGDMSNVSLNSTMINLPSNKLRGSLPQLSPNVVLFSVRNNSLQGSISPFLCQKMNGRSQLKYLDLSNNFLTGTLTDCWLNWKSLVVLKLNNNKLSSTIPTSLSFLSNLMTLHLSQNNLVGEIPLSLKNCQNLRVLDVGENKFSGYIPNWMRHNARVLLLRSNQFSGSIPPEICQLSSLITLDLADNQISGSIPICLHNLTAMAFSNSSSVAVASFCVNIPSGTYVFADEDLLHIKGQQLTYTKNLELVRAIDLSSNDMSGTIPQEIFSLTKLQSLNLSHNQFEGNIPNEIGNLKKLDSLDLASNRFSGKIPQTLVKLSTLETLNLSFNNFTGQIPLGTQLQGFDELSYIGNPELCGAPLPKNCTIKGNVEPIEKNDNQEDEFLSSFYIALGVGFATAFWGVCGAIFFNRTFRHSYFRFLYGIRDKLYVMVALRMNHFH